jgi:carbon monoxide dehydrogenase subunit G
MADYSFTTAWKFRAPLEQVWNEINNPNQWPQWWRGLQKVTEIEKGNASGVGCLREFAWKSVFPYTLTFKMMTTLVEPMRKIEGMASGDLDGTGLWSFTSEGEYTLVRYDWNVRTTGTMMNLLAPVARGIFTWNHNKIMEWGRQGLAKRLGIPAME